MSDVSIQSCGMNNNSVDPGPCRIAVNDLTLLAPQIILSDGNPHTVTITFAPPPSSCHGPCPGTLDVILDNNDLFSGGVPFDMTSIYLNSGTAWVGFTAATGGGDDNQDILSWTFTPQAQSALVTANALSTLSFPNANGDQVYNYTAQLILGRRRSTFRSRRY